jgi:peroxiredoxin
MKKACYLLLAVCIGVLPVYFSSAKAQTATAYTIPDIALPNPSGDTLRLSSLRGKWVLLDFWASWCAPCRVANKGLGKIYDKFHDKGFEIFSVSLDEEPADWEKAIRKDKIKWLQVIDPRGWEARTARDWRIEALPTSFLINPEGVIVAMDLEGKELEKTLKEILDK